MDTQSNSRRALILAQKQEDRRWRRNKRDLDMLQRQRNKGAKDWESEEKEIMPSVLLKLLVKDKLPYCRTVPVNMKEWQLNPRGEGNEVKANER